MSIRKSFLSVSIGLLIAVLAIGLLPFLIVLSFSEIGMFSELSATPLLLKRLYKNDTQKVKVKSSR